MLACVWRPRWQPESPTACACCRPVEPQIFGNPGKTPEHYDIWGDNAVIIEMAKDQRIRNHVKVRWARPQAARVAAAHCGWKAGVCCCCGGRRQHQGCPPSRPSACPRPRWQVVSQDLFNKYPHPETQCKGVYAEGDFLLHFAGEGQRHGLGWLVARAGQGWQRGGGVWGHNLLCTAGCRRMPGLTKLPSSTPAGAKPERKAQLFNEYWEKRQHR